MNETAILRIGGYLAETIRRIGAEVYPHECCGALLGRDGDAKADAASAAREAVDLFPLINRRDDSPRNRLPLMPKTCATRNKPRRPRDSMSSDGITRIPIILLNRASSIGSMRGPGKVTSFIVSVQNGTPHSMTSWRLRDDRAAFGSSVENRRGGRVWLFE